MTKPIYKHEVRQVSTLVPYIHNSREHSDAQVAQIVRSIEEFGFTNPILIEPSGDVIAGHCRLAAAKLLGMVDVPCIVLEGLTSAQKRAYVIADNALALNSTWNFDTLALEITDLKMDEFDISLVGIDESLLFQRMTKTTRSSTMTHR